MLAGGGLRRALEIVRLMRLSLRMLSLLYCRLAGSSPRQTLPWVPERAMVNLPTRATSR